MDEGTNLTSKISSGNEGFRGIKVQEKANNSVTLSKRQLESSPSLKVNQDFR